MVFWSEIKKLIPLGGLGLWSLMDINEALQDKWLWRFPIEEDVIWRGAIAAKYGMDERGWFARMGQDYMRKVYGKRLI